MFLSRIALSAPVLTMERSFESYFQDHRSAPEGLDPHSQPRLTPILTSAPSPSRYSTSWLLGGSTAVVPEPGVVPRVAPPSPTQVRFPVFDSDYQFAYYHLSLYHLLVHCQPSPFGKISTVAFLSI